MGKVNAITPALAPSARPRRIEPVGAEGLDVVAGEHLAVADTADGLARHCADLLTDRARRDAMAAAAGRLHVDRHLPEHAAALVQRAARRATAGHDAVRDSRSTRSGLAPL